MMNMRAFRALSFLVMVGLMTGCCPRKFDTWELSGYYVEQDYEIQTTRARTFSVENTDEFKGLNWVLLRCDPSEKVSGMVGW